MRNPTISVVIPTYNRANFIGEAIESVLAQSHAVDEIIVVDDGSTDQTAKSLMNYGGRIRYIRQTNSGPSAARNRGLQVASGDFISFLDSDDLWTPKKTEVQLAFFQLNPEVEFIFADMANFHGASKVGAAEIKNQELHNYLVDHAVDLKDLYSWLILENVVPTPTVMARRSAIQKVGAFNEKLRIVEDLEYWLRAIEVCRWGFIDDVLVLRRRHESNLIGDSNMRNRALLDVLTEAARRPTAQTPRLQNLILEKTENIRYDLGSALLRSRDYIGAQTQLSQIRRLGTRRVKSALKCIAAMFFQACRLGIHKLLKHPQKCVFAVMP